VSLINLTLKHGQTQQQAQARLATAVEDVRARFGLMVREVDWSAAGDSVTIRGNGFRVLMRVDPQDVHVEGDVPLLGALLGKPLEAGLKQIVHKSFGKGPA